MTFTLAMVKHPRVCKRAQADIDALVGTHRLPEFDDRFSLPYVDAILRETLRWQPPVPLGEIMSLIFRETLVTFRKAFRTPLRRVISTTVSSFRKVFQLDSLHDLLFITFSRQGQLSLEIFGTQQISSWLLKIFTSNFP